MPPPAPEISVITPTYGRQHYLGNLLRCFRQQTQPNLELLILDDSPSPAEAFAASIAGDPQVRYLHCQGRLSTGVKRNRLVAESRGRIIVQFDDDDYYAPRYVETMVRELGDGHFAKLSSWFGYSGAADLFFYWDTTKTQAIHYVVSPIHPLQIADLSEYDEAFTQANAWGYGFSYVFRREVFARLQFDDATGDEDYRLIRRMDPRVFRMKHFADQDGLVLHVIHASNSSISFPQYLLPPAVVRRIFGSDIESYLGFARAA